MMTSLPRALLFSLAVAAPAITWAQEAGELAKKLANPIASLVSVPIQFNHDSDIGSADGSRSVINVQPVIPFSISKDWNLISRTIVPLIHQNDVTGPSTSQSGMGDITQSLFFSPKEPTAGGLIWGVGPVILLPTASDDLLGAEKWGLGPTAVVLKQTGSWTYGMLGNHIWSVGGEQSRADISTTLLQPFVSYATSRGTSFTLNTESTYDWKSKQWSVPINANIGQVMRFGGQLVQLSAAARYWADAPPNGPSGWGLRFTFTLLFPK